MSTCHSFCCFVDLIGVISILKLFDILTFCRHPIFYSFSAPFPKDIIKLFVFCWDWFVCSSFFHEVHDILCYDSYFCCFSWIRCLFWVLVILVFKEVDVPSTSPYRTELTVSFSILRVSFRRSLVVPNIFSCHFSLSIFRNILKPKIITNGLWCLYSLLQDRFYVLYILKIRIE